MTESQAHGFTWETFIKESIYKVADKASYTRKNDIDSNENTIDNCAVSIKTSGSVSVDMGDARRIFQGTSSGEPLRMILIQYTQDETYKNLKAVLEVDLTGAWQELFGDVTYEEISRFHETLKEIPAGQVKNKDYLAISDSLNMKMGALSVRPKVDSKNQRRLQCSFKNIDDFCQIYPGRLLYKNTEGVLKGMQIVTSILSGRRIRHPRIRV
jgi:hypothetical protein